MVLGSREALLVEELLLTDCTWHMGELPANGLSCFVRTRHRARLVPAMITPRLGVGPTGLPNAVVRFAEPQPRTNAGQACVAYDEKEDLCLGGGWVTASE